MNEPSSSVGEAVPIDPAVALHETQLLMQAIDAHYRNRNLILAQRAQDLRGDLAGARREIDALLSAAQGAD